MARETNAKEDVAPSRGGRKREEWSCPVCTLLNGWRERRCAACDQERPEGIEAAPDEWNCPVCTLVNDWTDQRCVACDHERPPATTTSSTPSTSDSTTSMGASPAVRSRSHDTTRNRPATENGETKDSPTRPSRKRPLTPSTLSQGDVAQPLRLLHRTEDQQREDETQVEDLPEAPTFNLLGFINPPDPPVSQVDRHTSVSSSGSTHPEETSFHPVENGATPTIDLTDAPDAAAMTKPPDTETKLAQAGLGLSDSESENEGRVRHKLRRKSLAKPPSDSKVAAAADMTAEFTDDRRSHSERDEVTEASEWECEVCTHSNAPHVKRCELCDSTRHQLKSVHSSVPSSRPARSPSSATTNGECPVCTHMNPPLVEQCQLCETTFKKVECPVCTHLNPEHLAQCELCETQRDGTVASAVSVSREPSSSSTSRINKTRIACVVCTNLNDPHLEQCEVCETRLTRPPSPRNSRLDVIDLAASQPRAAYDHTTTGSDDEYEYDFSRTNRAASNDFDDDFEHMYGGPPASPEYARSPLRRRQQQQQQQPQQRDRHNYDRIEDISDNEMHSGMGSNFQQQQPPPRSQRPELHEFQHFLSVEDVRLDYQCQIDYRSMFADSSGSRTYADRLVKRRRDSQKRKRSRDQQSQDEPPSRRGKKKSAANSSGKKAKAKAKAPTRRASTGAGASGGGGAAAKKPRATKRSAASAKPRRASAPAYSSGSYSSGVNHYSTIDGDFGDDVSTMAWEGLGSAGYS